MQELLILGVSQQDRVQKILILKDRASKIKNNFKKFKKKFKKICLSLDTRKSVIMNERIQFGVDLINDVSGFNYDKNSLNFIKKNKISKVLTSYEGNTKHYAD